MKYGVNILWKSVRNRVDSGIYISKWDIIYFNYEIFCLLKQLKIKIKLSRKHGKVWEFYYGIVGYTMFIYFILFMKVSYFHQTNLFETRNMLRGKFVIYSQLGNPGAATQSRRFSTDHDYRLISNDQNHRFIKTFNQF